MGQEAHPEDREGSGGPLGGTRGVGRPTRRSGRGRDTQPEGPGTVGSPTLSSGKGWEANSKVWER